MIRVKKPKHRAPKAWLHLAAEERNAAIAHFKDPKTCTKPFVKGKTSLFRAYGHESLRDVLNELFCYKCAYCETHYGATQPVAIEHYRPKSEVSEGTKRIRPGYYWLAAEWANLFPSCTDCNSRRGHKFPDGTRQTLGKGNEFPLARPDRRATGPGEERGEQPLLLNPSKDFADRHLRFYVVDGSGDVVAQPTISPSGKVSVRGETSIRVYALNRPQLVKRRRMHALRLDGQIRFLRKCLETMNAAPPDNRTAAIAVFEAEVDQLRECFLSSDSEYVGMARQLISERMPALRGII